MNPLTVSPERLERLRQICLTLPQATEKVAWGDPTWRVRDKIFAMQKGNVEGGRPALWLKAPEGAQAALVEGDPKRFFVPPYVGHKGWVGVYLDTRSIEWPMLESLVEESYRMIAPKRLAASSSPATRKPASRKPASSKPVPRAKTAQATQAAKKKKKVSKRA